MVEETEQKLTYSEDLDKFFIENKFVVKTMRDDFIDVNEDVLPNVTIATTSQFHKYLITERNFWNYQDIGKNSIVSNYPDIINRTLTTFENLISIKSITQIDLNNLENSVKQFLKACQISSKSTMAQFFKSNSAKEAHFFKGFESAITGKNINIPTLMNQSSWHEGFICGLDFKDGRLKLDTLLDDQKVAFKEEASAVKKMFTEMLADYAGSFHEQEKKVAELWKVNEDEIKNRKEEYDRNRQEDRGRFDTLEKLYSEKLRLAKPAEYWEKMAKNYAKNGYIWLGISFILSLIIIFGAFYIINNFSDIFQDNDNLLNLIRNTTLLTVITGIAIYILRIAVKLALSYLHLSRDSKEREQLSYFYLSLINEKAITDTERSIIINSLFSRSETGLLKGDSTPIMTTNVADIVDKDR